MWCLMPKSGAGWAALNLLFVPGDGRNNHIHNAKENDMKLTMKFLVLFIGVLMLGNVANAESPRE